MYKYAEKGKLKCPEPGYGEREYSGNALFKQVKPEGISYIHPWDMESSWISETLLNGKERDFSGLVRGYYRYKAS